MTTNDGFECYLLLVMIIFYAGIVAFHNVKPCWWWQLWWWWEVNKPKFNCFVEVETIYSYYHHHYIWYERLYKSPCVAILFYCFVMSLVIAYWNHQLLCVCFSHCWRFCCILLLIPGYPCIYFYHCFYYVYSSYRNPKLDCETTKIPYALEKWTFVTLKNQNASTWIFFFFF